AGIPAIRSSRPTPGSRVCAACRHTKPSSSGPANVIAPRSRSFSTPKAIAFWGKAPARLAALLHRSSGNLSAKPVDHLDRVSLEEPLQHELRYVECRPRSQLVTYVGKAIQFGYIPLAFVLRETCPALVFERQRVHGFRGFEHEVDSLREQQEAGDRLLLD